MKKKPLGATVPFSNVNGAEIYPHPEVGMIFSTSLPGFKTFFGSAACKSTDLVCGLLFLTNFLLPVARRSAASASRCVLNSIRSDVWLLQWLAGSKAPAALLAAAQEQLLALAHRSSKRRWVIAIDSTCHSLAGKHTCNTFATRNTRKRPARSTRKQKKTNPKSSHCFVCALVLTPCGLRIPYLLPFYTKEYGQLWDWRHRTQADLAAQLLDDIPVPKNVPVVVVGDTAFESKQLRASCRRRGWQWVVPLNPERRLAGRQGQRQSVRSLFDQLTAQDFRRVSFRLDQGEHARQARVSPSKSGSKNHQRSYWVNHRTAAIHHLGEVALLFSTKQDPNQSLGGVKVQKVLVSNAVGASTEDLLRWYALRWQVEQFFREMKSEIGMCQYKLNTGPFRRVEGWVNLSLASFCYLEWYRCDKEKAASGKKRAFWQRLRTHDLKAQLGQEVLRADLEEVLRRGGTEEGRKSLNVLLDRLGDDPAATPESKEFSRAQSA
jgi:hypothetical protein